jgi:uncharacterized small protein (DUF1192 family)
MVAFDEEPRKKPMSHEVGQDLSALSVHELDERIALLEGEIARLRTARDAKTLSKSAAEGVFRMKG